MSKHLFALSCLLFSVCASAQEQIPALGAEDVINIILFELDHLTPEQILVESVRTLHDRAKAVVAIGPTRLTLLLRCRQSDFGPVWDLETGEAARLVETVTGEEAAATGRDATGAQIQPPAADPPERQDADRAQTPVDYSRPAARPQLADYQPFLVQFISALHSGHEQAYPDFYYEADDFNPLSDFAPSAEQFAQEQQAFLAACTRLSDRLGVFDQCEVLGVRALGIPDRLLAQLQTLMPSTTEFYNSAVIDLQVDGRQGYVVIEGLALTGGGWRIGSVESYDLP